MDDSKVKSVVKLIVLICLIIACIPFVNDFIKSDEEAFDDKTIELFDSSISGYKNGKLSWKIYTDNIWSKKSRYLFYSDSIVSGIIYNDNGKVVIDSIKAKDLKINTRSNSITVSKGLTARVFTSNKSSKKGLHASEDNKNQIKIKSKELRFFNESKRTYLSEDVELVKGDTTIKPLGEIEIDTNLNVVYINNGFSIESSAYKVTGNSMTIYIDEEESYLSGDIVFEKFPSENINGQLDEQEKHFRKNSTFLYCDSALYKDIEDKDMLEVSGNVVIIQEGKKLTAKEGLYDEADNSFSLEKNIQVNLHDLSWILDENKKSELKNEDIKNSLNLKTTITGDKLYFNGNKKQTRIYGNVVVTQSDKTIWADKLILYDEKALVECFGNVKVLKENKDSINSEYLKIDLNRESFIAKDGVLSEYHLKK
jgi:lipopolysaccharide export system protein LptA